MPKRPTDHPADAASARNSSPAFTPAFTPVLPPSPNTPIALLGNLSPSQFMRRYWQKKPLLIRQAIPNVEAPLSRDEFFELADQDEVEARLITHFRKKWQLEHGPFAPDELPSAHGRYWCRASISTTTVRVRYSTASASCRTRVSTT
jgi:50S ribosomal protein L16 3-hydroxylase